MEIDLLIKSSIFFDPFNHFIIFSLPFVKIFLVKKYSIFV